MGHTPSTGQPYTDPGNGPEFFPKGEPKDLTDKGAAEADASAESEAALKEFAGVSKRSRSSSMPNKGQKADIPLDSQKSIYNAPPSG